MGKNQQTDVITAFFGSLKRESRKKRNIVEWKDGLFTPLAHCYQKDCRDRTCNHKRRFPKHRKIAAFDTENWQRDGDGHRKGDFRCGSIYDGSGYRRFTNPRAMGQCLLSRAFAGVYVWAHNLAYDLQNIWGSALPQTGSIIGSQLCFADYALRTSHDPKKSRAEYVHFRDSTRHYPAKLSTLASKLKMQKLFEKIDDLDSLDESAIQDRCDSDSFIVYSFIHQLQETYNELGTSLRATVGSSSLEYFRRMCMVHSTRKLDDDRLETLCQAYYGGRCESFYIGSLPTGRYSMGDVNSMYASVMENLQLPIPSREYCFFSESAVSFDREGASECSVSVPESMYPPLPYREPDSGKLLFPFGRFRAWWTHNEIRYALQCGVRIEQVHQSIWFSATCIPFKDFVRTLYGLKLQGGWKALVAKHLLNNNYGKWNQSRPPKQLLPASEYIGSNITDPVTPMYGKDGELISVLVQPEGYQFPIHSNIIWGSYITAGSRIKIHQLLEKHKGLYCDTDSCLLEGRIPKTDGLGELSLETSCTGAYLAGPKAYALFRDGQIEKLKVKGIPNRPGWVKGDDGNIYDTADLQAMALMGYQIFFDSPLKLIEGFRKKTVPQMLRDVEGQPYLSGEEIDAAPNIWYTHSRQLQLKCDKRILDGKSGWTRPIEIKE
jgi:hypothetical protein